MRELWREIDRARAQFGFGGASANGAAAPAWSIGWLAASAGSLAGRATACMSECALLASAVGWLRQVPILGRLAALIPAAR